MYNDSGETFLKPLKTLYITLFIFSEYLSGKSIVDGYKNI